MLRISQRTGHRDTSEHDCEMGKFVSFTRTTQTYKARGSTGIRIKTIQRGHGDSALHAKKQGEDTHNRFSFVMPLENCCLVRCVPYSLPMENNAAKMSI
jgi:hypothetical protein